MRYGPTIAPLQGLIKSRFLTFDGSRPIAALLRPFRAFLIVVQNGSVLGITMIDRLILDHRWILQRIPNGPLLWHTGIRNSSGLRQKGPQCCWQHEVAERQKQARFGDDPDEHIRDQEERDRQQTALKEHG